MRKILLIIGILLVCFILFLGGVSYSSKLSNPFLALKGVAEIELGSHNAAIISREPLIIITRRDDNIAGYMEELGFKFEEQLGREYVFEKDFKSILLISEGFTGRYVLLIDRNKKT